MERQRNEVDVAENARGAFEEICIADSERLIPYKVAKGKTVSSAAIMKMNITQSVAE